MAFYSSVSLSYNATLCNQQTSQSVSKISILLVLRIGKSDL